MSNLEVKTTNADIMRGRSDAKYKEVVQIGQWKCRVQIRRNFYDFQSNATIEIWSPTELQWNELDHIFFTDMQTKESLHVEPGDLPTVQDFATDRNILIEKAVAILS